MGITEPALYGVTLKLKRPVVAAAIAAGIGGIVGGLLHVSLYIAQNCIMAIPAFIGETGMSNLLYGIIMIVVSFVASFVLTFIFGFEDAEPEQEEKKTESKEAEKTPQNNTKPLVEKIETIAKEIYGADKVNFEDTAMKELQHITDMGFAHFPVCMAKTQYSLSDNPKLLGRPEHFTINVREVYVNAGAGFVVVMTGKVLTMPGLPKVPAANNIDYDEVNEKIVGLF